MFDCLKKQFEYLVKNDPYQLKPETLFKNISGSLMGCNNEHCIERLAEIYMVPSYLLHEVNDLLKGWKNG